MEMIPLCSVELDVGTRYPVGRTPFGDRLIGEITGGRWEGERFKANMVGVAAADWAIGGADGLMYVDVRMTLETDDGALAYVHYTGLMDTAVEGAPIRTSIRFETPAEQYQWMTRTICVGDGRFDEPNLKVLYDVYELR
ncbi:MAG: DUF3237 domain-containing protein [Deltaproteobacteria bacterium]|jgi:hypothetical protein|nr:DUF3237 domain-containing protein [Deltaproteobacteria bacterium]